MKELILRFLEGHASEEEASRLLAWLQENETNRIYFDELNTAFQSSVTLNRVNHQMTDDAWKKLATATGAEKNTVRPGRSITFTVLNIAASVCLLIMAGALLVYNLPHHAIVRHDTIVRTASGNNTRVVLPDGSVVWLNLNSTLEYPAEFGSASRDVVLKGEAFFDVRKGSKPFTVKTDDILIRVKGTRFNVQAFKNDPTIKTTLEEGKVELHVSGKNKIYSMAPGDQVVFNAERKEVTMQRVDPSNFTAWKEDQLVFDNTPLNEIISKLENRFRVSISINERLAKRERISMTIENENLDEVLDLIQLSSRLKVRRDKNTIVLFE
ncbi:MAG TPA: FecR domain-containing protein [Ohtaekwangia sp.]|uniref:FecR family protein n=1 Tax=Ohtaekwangia sp. TaxID=2066019 RepID=UPI002F9584B0